MIEFILVSASAIGLFGLIRMLLASYTSAWYTRLHRDIDDIVPWDCSKFHEIQSRPRPWGVKINEWMEEHHV